MKLIKEVFNDEDYKLIKEAKDNSKLTWRKYLVASAKRWLGKEE